MHWSLPDPPAAATTDDAGYPEFCRVATELDIRNRFLLTLLTPASTSRSADHVEHRN